MKHNIQPIKNFNELQTLKPGVLIFYKESKKETEKVTYIGILKELSFEDYIGLDDQVSIVTIRLWQTSEISYVGDEASFYECDYGNDNVNKVWIELND